MTAVLVHDPRMPAMDHDAVLAPRDGTLRAGPVLLLDNSKLAAAYGPYGAIFDTLEQELPRLAPGATTERLVDDLNVGSPARLDALAADVSGRGYAGVVLALCDWGVSQPTTLLAGSLERLGVPTVVMTTETGYLQAAAVAARTAPGLPVVPFPLLRDADRDDVAAQTLRLLPQLHGALALPVGDWHDRFPTSTAPAAPTAHPGGMINLGDGHPSETLTALLAADGLGDGLPLVPPTPRAVSAFLAAAGRDAADEVWPRIAPRPRPVTAIEVATVAVMAGCEARWAPVVFAAYGAMAAPEFRLFQAAITTHPGGYLVLVSGPAARELDIASGRGCLGPGFPANARIGRAVALSSSFLLGAQPGGSSLVSQGSPAQYSYCCAENLAESPWPGVHADLGHPDETTVTVVKAEGPHNMIDQKSTRPEPLLDTFLSTIATLGANTAYAPSAQTILLLNPEHAALLSQAGWTKADVRDYLFARARNPLKDLLGRGQGGMWPPSFDGLDPVPVVERAEDFVVAVVGGAGPASQVAIPWGMGRGATRPLPR